MDSVKPKSSRLVHAFAKVLRFRVAGVAPDDRIRKLKFPENGVDLSQKVCKSQLPKDDDEKVREREAMEALLAKLFANISAIKAAYAQLQIAQSPYDPETIHLADGVVITELKNLSELKRCYLKKQIIPSHVSQMMAEIQEQQNLLKTYEILSKKLQSQIQLKESEMIFLREKLQEAEDQNKLLEKRINPPSPLSINLHLSGLNPNHFIAVLRHTVKSIRSFTKLMINGMESAGWDLEAAATAIEADVINGKPSHRIFAFESFVCQRMFRDFQNPHFSLSNDHKQRYRRRHFFENFTDFKSIKPMEFLLQSPESLFGKFCRLKYLGLIHPKMEGSFFGNLSQRSVLNSCGFPETDFFAAFAEMAKRVWILHLLAFSFEPEASIFQVRKGCRFSDVYMESVIDGVFFLSDKTSPETVRPTVSFTVVPGFKVGKTVVQGKVYISGVR